MKKYFLTFSFIMIVTFLYGQGKFTDTRDGNVYRTITVQGVTWMAENLKFRTSTGAYLFDNNTSNLPFYGMLYEWKTAVNACPTGWHLPSGREFQTLLNLTDHVDSWTEGPSGPHAFAIELGGMQDKEGTFSEMDESAYYWTSTEYDNSNAEYFSYLLINKTPVVDISRKEDIAEIPGTEKDNKYSVRCIRN
jgi:uncharacterized protein (TIGR02145 family)